MTRPTMRQIASEVAEEFGLNVARLRGPEKVMRVAWPRMYAMWRCRQETINSTTAVGMFFGRDHTSVLYAEKRVIAGDFQEKLAGLRQIISPRFSPTDVLGRSSRSPKQAYNAASNQEAA